MEWITENPLAIYLLSIVMALVISFLGLCFGTRFHKRKRKDER